MALNAVKTEGEDQMVLEWTLVFIMCGVKDDVSGVETVGINWNDSCSPDRDGLSRREKYNPVA